MRKVTFVPFVGVVGFVLKTTTFFVSETCDVVESGQIARTSMRTDPGVRHFTERFVTTPTVLSVHDAVDALELIVKLKRAEDVSAPVARME